MKPPLKLCIIGNPDSIHVQRWARHFASRGFEVSLLSYYEPKSEFGANPNIHFVRARRSVAHRKETGARAAMNGFPGLSRLITAARFKAAGFYQELDRINPHVLHAHYVSHYGFMAALSGRHPFVVSAWGSDLLVDPDLSRISRRLTRWVLERADLVTYSGAQLGRVAGEMGAPAERLLEVVLGVGPEMLDALETRMVSPADRQPIILSQRSLERSLYNVDAVIMAMPAVLQRVPSARLVVGGDGALRDELEGLAHRLGVAGAVDFAGVATWPAGLAERLGRAAVYVSVPSSEGTSVTLLEAMSAGAYPVVSDVPANREWVDASGGTVVPVKQVLPLAEAIISALGNPGLRASAAIRNRRLIEERGLWDLNMARMEEAYHHLARVNSGEPIEEVH